MELRARTRLPLLRRAAMMAALGAIIVPATAGAATAQANSKFHLPVIKKVSPTRLTVGEELTLRGKYFRRGRGRDSVVFKRDHGKAVFVKARFATKRLIVVKVPTKLAKFMTVKGGVQVATRFRLRVLTKKLGKKFTSNRLSPVIAPLPPAVAGTPGTARPGSSAPVSTPAASTPPASRPDGDCDKDSVLNSVDVDDDNDGLTDAQEALYGLNRCSADTDGDGVSDGFEFRSAVDLNDDDYQHPNQSVPYPGKRPYPNPLYRGDANTDFDGDGLTLGTEYKLWRYSVAHNGQPDSINHLSYSDGLKYSIYTRDASHNNRRVPALPAAGYDMETKFLSWANTHGYGMVALPDSADVLRPIFDFDRNGSADPDVYDRHGEISSGRDGFLSDDERDEDADGLANYFETIGPMEPGWWTAFYPKEPAFPIEYAGTSPVDPDSDGDGVLDGADDQDNDGYPNVVEASRARITGVPFTPKDATQAQLDLLDLPSYGRVNPFNPCLPYTRSATCPTFLPVDGKWAPFEDNDLDYAIVS